LRRLPCQCVLATAVAEDENFHRAFIALEQIAASG
jgi:hypothetical protein